MGQQQLLLIVLSTIIVGISIAVGINIVTTSAGQANFDAVMQDLLVISERARDWYRKPALTGGGGNDFTGLDLQANIGWPAANENGAYTISTAGNATTIVFQGIGVEDLDQDGTNATIQVAAFRDSVVTTIVNR